VKINILQIIRGLDIGGDSGGAELFGVKLAQELNKNPHCDVWICAFFRVGTKTEQDWCEKLNDEGIKTFFVSEWGGYNNFRQFHKGIRTLISKISQIKLDVCHSHFQLGTLAAVILKRFGYTKTAYRTSHIRKEWDYGKWTWFLSPIFIKRIFPSYLDGEIGVSKAVYDYLINRRPKKLDPSKIHLIHNGIDINKIEQESKEPLKETTGESIARKGRIIGCVGRLAEQKGYPYIFRAMQTVITHYSDCVLQIVGDGELNVELHQMVADLNLVEHVEFLGLRSDVPALMRTWYVFVLPSLWEGFPTVVMEAMICNVPVIATDIPGTNELVIHEKTGLLVPTKEVESLTDAIIRIFKHPDLRNRLVIEAKKHAEKFNMENIAESYYQLFLDNMSVKEDEGIRNENS
jgi:glycosyltransferase involved in cell wall biosynthesis